MLTTPRARFAALVATGAMSLGAAGAAEAQTQQNGLVNVDLSGNTVQVPVAVAANICGVQANVLAVGNFGGNAVCESASRSDANDGGGGDGGGTNQDGLINVAITDNTIQVPIGIAANVCGVQANVIAANNFGGNAVCDSTSRSNARS